MPAELVELFQQMFNALRISGVYALVALGITVIFGLTGIVKFSIGELLTVGAFLAFAFWDSSLSFFIAVPLAVNSKYRRPRPSNCPPSRKLNMFLEYESSLPAWEGVRGRGRLFTLISAFPGPGRRGFQHYEPLAGW